MHVSAALLLYFCGSEAVGLRFFCRELVCRELVALFASRRRHPLSTTMAPKEKKLSTAAAPSIVRRVIGTTQLKLSAISVAEGSGWRPVDHQRVSYLAQEFLNGQYLRSILSRPSVLRTFDSVRGSQRLTCL